MDESIAWDVQQVLPGMDSVMDAEVGVVRGPPRHRSMMTDAAYNVTSVNRP